MDWEQGVADLWASSDQYSDEAFVARMDALVAELPPNNAAGVYERASAFDSTGHSDLAVPLYRQALALGLNEDRRRQAVIQLASSLRNLGEVEESVRLLRAEQLRRSDDLDDAISAFLALALVDSGGEREAVSLALLALTKHMTRYQRSLANYARLIVDPVPKQIVSATIRRGEYTISTDRNQLNIVAIHSYLTRSYWSPGVSFEIVERAIANSLPFGLFHDDEQVGFARVVSDQATFAYLADVYVLEAHRGKGLSKWLMEIIQADARLQGLRRMLLATKDAHELYRRFGFTELANPSRLMEIVYPNIYRTP